jgi:hypothetical protein
MYHPQGSPLLPTAPEAIDWAEKPSGIPQMSPELTWMVGGF